MRGPGVATGLLLALALAACNSSSSSGGAAIPAVAIPTRAPTAGDRLLARVPAGPSLVLEVDLARLRANPALGATVAALIDRAGAAPVTALDWEAPLAGADAMLLAAYRIGSDQATAITIVEGGTRPDAALVLDERTWALADEGETATLLATAAGGASAAGDAALLAIRAEAMPIAAEGASVRLAARLDPAAQAGLADALGLDDAPAAISLWADVADDLALIAWLGGGQTEDDSVAAARLLVALRARLAGLLELRLLGLAPSVAAGTVERDRAGARGVVVIGPRRLARALARWQAHREATPPP